MDMENSTDNHKQPHPTAITAAAEALQNTHYLLILAGAGFSADSGLDTYECLPDEYRELCDPALLRTGDAAAHQRFQQFWIGFATVPHAGYDILDQWCDGGKLPSLVRKDNGNGNGSRPAPSPWWVYTSNVDGHFRRFTSFADSLCEIHGRANEFRCASGMGYHDTGDGLVERVGAQWKSWNDRVNANVDVNVGHTKRVRCDSDFIDPVDQPNDVLRCRHCHTPARPNVLLFHDTDPNVLRDITAQRERYQSWEARMEDAVVNAARTSHRQNLVVLELGCGTTVPAVRQESEEVYGDLLARLTASHEQGGFVTFIRVNPKHADIDETRNSGHGRVISIRDTSLSALRSINECLTERNVLGKY